MLRAIVFLLLIDTCCAAATVKMRVGWDGAYRVGRWTPVYVTASDSAPRSVILELYVSHDQKNGIRVRQMATISPAVTTFVLYAPVGVSQDDLSVTLRDAKTEQRLATATSGDVFTPLHPLLADAVSQLVVVSGTDMNPALPTQLNETGAMTCRWVDPIRLPSVALGYDALNLLILSRPDLGKIGIDQQDAMLDWIRAGGNLLCWIGPDALPSTSPLLNALPATIGSNGAMTIFSHTIGARELTAAANAKQISLLDGQIIAWQKRLGFGTITLLPVDPSALNFENAAQWSAFWSPLLSGAVDLRGGVGQERAADRYVDAVAEERDALGANASSPKFDFHPIWLILIIAAGIVGPLDGFVLKKLNHRPWTFSTVAGWIGFIILCGIGLTRAASDEPADARSIELIDQADGITVARMRIVNRMGIAADPDPQAWCEPFAADKTILPRTDVRFDLDLHEDQHGTRSVPTASNRRVPQMLLSQSIEPAAPAIGANLRLEFKAGKPALVGTISNLGKFSLENAMIRTKNGVCTLPSIAEGATININTPLAGDSVAPAHIWNLAITRTLAIDDQLSRDNHLACFTAATSSESPNVIHIRALISLTSD